MAATARTQDSASADPTRQPSENVDKIRDILFGNNIREYERRFSELETKLASEAAELREEIRKRFNLLDGHLREEISALAERLSSEKRDRTETVEKINAGLGELDRSLERKSLGFEEQISRTHRDMHQKILQHSETLQEDLRSRSAELAGKIERNGKELRSEKLDRAALASLFGELSVRLSNSASPDGGLSMLHLESLSSARPEENGNNSNEAAG